MKRWTLVFLFALIAFLVVLMNAPPALADTQQIKLTTSASENIDRMVADANVSISDTQVVTSGAPPDNASTAIGPKNLKADGLAITAPDYYFLTPQNTDVLTESGYSSTSSANTADLDVSGSRLCAFKNPMAMADNGLTARLSRH